MSPSFILDTFLVIKKCGKMPILDQNKFLSLSKFCMIISQILSLLGSVYRALSLVMAPRVFMSACQLCLSLSFRLHYLSLPQLLAFTALLSLLFSDHIIMALNTLQTLNL